MNETNRFDPAAMALSRAQFARALWRWRHSPATDRSVGRTLTGTAARQVLGHLAAVMAHERLLAEAAHRLRLEHRRLDYAAIGAGGGSVGPCVCGACLEAAGDHGQAWGEAVSVMAWVPAIRADFTGDIAMIAAMDNALDAWVLRFGYPDWDSWAKTYLPQLAAA